MFASGTFPVIVDVSFCILLMYSFPTRTFNCVNAQPSEGVSLDFVTHKLEEFAHTSLAASWDNVGLLLEQVRPQTITKILLTNDLTEDVMDEAVLVSAGLIISYHPPIFTSLQRITKANWKERIILKCLANNIAVYSPHTSWDVVQGGVNDWLTSAFECSEVTPAIPRKTGVDEAEHNSVDGTGRVCTLTTPIRILDAVNTIKKHIGVSFLRLALARNARPESLVRTIAFGAGSGGKLLKNTVCDLKVVGEAGHHDVLDSVHCGASVVVTEHSNSERGFLWQFKEILASMLNNLSVEIVVSSTDADPLRTI